MCCHGYFFWFVLIDSTQHLIAACVRGGNHSNGPGCAPLALVIEYPWQRFTGERPCQMVYGQASEAAPDKVLAATTSSYGSQASTQGVYVCVH